MCRGEHSFSTDMLHCVPVLCQWGITMFHYAYLPSLKLFLSEQDFADTHRFWLSPRCGSGQGSGPHFSRCPGPSAPDAAAGLVSTSTQPWPARPRTPQSQAHPRAHTAAHSRSHPQGGAQCVLWGCPPAAPGCGGWTDHGPHPAASLGCPCSSHAGPRQPWHLEAHSYKRQLSTLSVTSIPLKGWYGAHEYTYSCALSVFGLFTQWPLL